MSDPFSAVYNHLWGLAEANTWIADNVKKHNRIKFDQEEPIKKTVGDGDIPELVLHPIGGAEQPLQLTSNQFEIKPRFQWLLTTGDYFVKKRLFPMSWNLYLVMATFRANMGAVQWNSQSFVKQVSILSNETGDVNAEQNRGIGGYSAVLSFELTCRFNKSILG